ncbi:latent-transforming growth factor beta-binding protein 4-like [Xenopus laevis]|uniref:Latent-transforming growth factor beta-binding protein 4-like n=2 Tax=Xenopus laevis TaxID=8355 RepID=A0A1L8H2M7_XENLA|nr:latent-transforming growth factor beta-binding protein 4-like [Xenopus laevis]OCT90353.1 hypothetical protein XELAEV_18018965mg [Xenopus laevis]
MSCSLGFPLRGLCLLFLFSWSVGKYVVPERLRHVAKCGGHTGRCPKNSTCEPTRWGNFCICETGFFNNKEKTAITYPGGQCDDIDECLHSPSSCSPPAICTNTPGSYLCTCRTGKREPAISKRGKNNLGGYYIIPRLRAVTQCKRQTLVCPEHSTCEPTPWGDFCICKEGFYNTKDRSIVTYPGGRCADIDECTKHPSYCQAPFICNNTLGSYTCTCPYDTAENDTTVPIPNADINECLMDPSICKPPMVCSNNTPGSHMCGCDTGYYKSFIGQNGINITLCLDIDECVSNRSLCQPPALCTNTPGSHSCSCPTGYIKQNISKHGDNRITCTDIDECVGSPPVCKPPAVCSNTPGSYLCTCTSGNVELAMRKRYKTVIKGKGGYYIPLRLRHAPRCKRQGPMCPNHSACEPTQWGDFCICKEGFYNTKERSIITYPGGKCDDIDECTKHPSFCQSPFICTNTLGSYTCTCANSSAEDVPDTATSMATADIDECLYHPSLCKTPSVCTDVRGRGGYRCVCPAGYNESVSKRDNQTTCLDIDECVSKRSLCQPPANCTNTPGSYICTCPAGYIKRKVGNNFTTCQDIDECIRSPSVCKPPANCTNTPGSYLCTCTAGTIQPAMTRKLGSIISGLGGYYISPRFRHVPQCRGSFPVCPLHSSCQSTNWGAFCICNNGFYNYKEKTIITYPGGKCEDIDECTKPSSCQAPFNCTNTRGSYTCACPNGTSDPHHHGR